MQKTAIEWVKNPDGTQGYTWNPITGCLNGCEYCYARKLANTRLKERYLGQGCIISPYDKEGNVSLYESDKQINDPFYPRFWEDRLRDFDNLFAINEPNFLRRLPKKPRGIFVCDMSDLFGIGIPEEWTRNVFQIIEQCPQNDRFYLLTKQPQNLIKFSPFPDNCWVGVTATNSEMYCHAAYWLREIEAQVKYISIEPMLEPILPNKGWPWGLFPEGKPGGICDWVILGSQTKPYKPPKIEWVREIVEACDKAGVKVFLKDNLKPMLEKENSPECYNGVLGRWMTDGNGGMVYRLRLRQEMPSSPS